MQIFDRVASEDYENVVFCHDRDVGLRAVIAVHSTVLGPAVGGTRFLAYPDEDAAVEDVLRLAKGMTYKAACAGLDMGGGKAVIIGDPATTRSPELIEAYARHVHRLGGAYLTAEDVGTTLADMDRIRTFTPYVTGTDPAKGGSGDPSETTAHGVFHAMAAVAERLWGTGDLGGLHIAIAGVGKVGTFLAELLHATGARLTVADVDTLAAARCKERFGATVVDPSAVHAVPCDLYSPCALGSALSRTTIPALACQAVVGSANNQLADPGCAGLLAERGITYAPDYVVNAGGIVNIAEELKPEGYDRGRALSAVRRIGATTTRVLETADAQGITTAEAADHLAEERIKAAKGARV